MQNKGKRKGKLKMLVSKEAIRLDIPHEEGEWVEVVKLPWVKLRAARKANEKENREIAKEFGAEFVKALSSSDDSEKAENRAKNLIKSQQYDESNFDTHILLDAGLVGWSYGEKVTPDAEFKYVEVDPKSIDMLDERTVVWIKQEIINLTKPLTEAQEKNF
jgi:hypothetical protein